MKRILTSLFVASLTLAPGLIASAHAEGVGQEAANHPRIVAAIRELEQTIKYLEAAPHDFGGHRAAAVNASKAALVELNKALQYRAAVDTRHGK